MLVPIDIETIPTQPEDTVRAAIAETIQAPTRMTTKETIDAWHLGKGKYAGAKEMEIDKQYRGTALDGAKGQIISISWALEFDEPQTQYLPAGDFGEAALLDNFFGILREQLNKRPPMFAGHFLNFDLPYLYQRAVINRINPGIELGHYGRHERDYFDTMVAWAGWKGTISLDNLCLALGIDIPGPEGLKGSTVWDFYKAGKHVEIQEYNRIDVRKVQAIIKRLRFV